MLRMSVFKKIVELCSEKNAMVLLGVLAFCSYLIFNAVVPFDFFNHDLGGLDVHHGHMGYMWHIWENWTLPVFSIDPVTEESYYNPPLHYILGALWIRCVLFFTDSVRLGFEYLQILTSIYMVGVLIFFYKILKLLKIKHMLLAWMYLCFNPMMFILSSIINNDGLIFLTMTATFYYGLCWYYEPSLKNMVKTAVWTGLCLMTKFSGILVVFVLAMLFCIRFVLNKSGRIGYLRQLIVYLVLAGSLGGWYYGYAYWRYQMPVDYVQGDRDPNSDIGEKHNLFERLVHEEWADIYVKLYDDDTYNMLSMGLKTSIFDEHEYSGNLTLTRIGGVLLFFSSVFFYLVCFLTLYALFYYPFSRWKLPVFICVFYIVILFAAYIHFNIIFPHCYTANFRYVSSFYLCAICLWNKLLNDKTVLFYLIPYGVAMCSILFQMLLIFQEAF